MSLLDSFPHTCTAAVRGRSQDALGGTVDTGSPIFSGRECWAQASGEGEVDDYDKRGISYTHKVYFRSDPGLDERHQLIIDQFPGKVLDVVSRADPDASAGLAAIRDVVWRVMANERTVDN